MRERNTILGICNLGRLSTVFGEEPICITLRKGSGIDEGHRRKPSEGLNISNFQRKWGVIAQRFFPE